MHIFEVSDDGSFRIYNKQNVLPGPLKIAQKYNIVIFITIYDLHELFLLHI
jgi:hypothetical protein